MYSRCLAACSALEAAASLRNRLSVYLSVSAKCLRTGEERWIHMGSTLQRIEIRARQLLQFAEVACVKTKSRTKHLFFQIQMKMRCQTCEHPEAGVIVKFANNPLAVIQNLIGQG